MIFLIFVFLYSKLGNICKTSQILLVKPKHIAIKTYQRRTAGPPDPFAGTNEHPISRTQTLTVGIEIPWWYLQFCTFKSNIWAIQDRFISKILKTIHFSILSLFFLRCYTNWGCRNTYPRWFLTDSRCKIHETIMFFKNRLLVVDWSFLCKKLCSLWKSRLGFFF